MMNPNEIKEWAGALVPYIAFFTAFWAIHTYRRAKKVEVARLQKQIFDDLHLSGKFDRVREALDFDYGSRVEPALEDSGLLTSSDRLALLSYWLGWMRKPQRQRLRDYIEKFDYERLSKCLNAEEKA